MIGNIPDKVVDKLPGHDEYKKSPKSVVSYIFMILFFVHFIWTQFISKDDCGTKMDAFEKVIQQQNDIMKTQGERIKQLEIALDVKNGVIRRVEHKADSLSYGGQR